MEFKNNTTNLSDMDLCLVKLKDKTQNSTGFCVCVYRNNKFYDAFLFEQGEVHTDDDLTKHVESFLYLGEKYC